MYLKNKKSYLRIFCIVVLYFIVQFTIYPFEINAGDYESISKNDKIDNKELSKLFSKSKNYLLNEPKKAKTNAFNALKEAKKTKNDTHIAKSYLLLAKSYKKLVNIDSALFYIIKSYEILENSSFSYLKGLLYNEITEIKILEGQYDDAIIFANKLNAIGDSITNKHFIALAYKNKGLISANLKQYDKALNSYYKAKDICETNNNALFKAQLINNIGKIHQKEGDLTNGLNYFEKAFKIYDSLDHNIGVAKTYNNLGKYYLINNNFNKCFRYYNNALDVYDNIGNEFLKGNTFFYLGNAFYKKNDTSNALKYYRQALKNGRNYGDQLLVIKCLNKIGEIYLNKNETKKGIESLKKALKINTLIGNKKQKQKALNLLTSFYEKKGNYEKAFKNYKIFKGIKDSLINEEVRHKVIALNSPYNFKNKENGDKLSIQQKQNQVTRSESKALKTKILFITIIFLLVIIILVLISLLQKRKVNKIQEQKNRMVNKYKDELLEKNKELKRQNQKLEEINKEKNNLMSIVSHDLKSPLNKISGFTHILKLTGQNFTEEQKDCVDKINRTVDDGRNMITNLLDLSKITENNFRLTFRDVDINKLIDDLVSDYHYRAEQKGIKLRYYNQMVDHYTRGDKTQLYQVFDNIISNAFKFSGFNKSIYIKTYNVVDKIRVEIEDEGPGISKEEQKQLFKKYQKLSPRPTDGENSTGLGLHIVQKLIHMHDGNIYVESKKGVGSKFIIELNKAPQ